MSDSAAASPETSRRRLLAWLGVGGAAALATLFSRDEAKAGHDGTNVLHLGETNFPPGGSSTGIGADTDAPVLTLHNTHEGDNSGGLSVNVRGSGGPAIHADDDGARDVVLQGVSGCCEGFAQGSGTGVQGLSGSGSGIQGRSDSGPGVAGFSATGTGGVFQSDSGVALQTIGPAAVGADVANFAFSVDNEHAGETAGGIFVVGRGGKPAIEADALPGEFGPGVALQGVSGTHETFGQGPGTGVQGISGTGIGVEAISAEGLALRVDGRAAFSTVGSAVVLAGEESVFVANAAVTTDSHIAVALTSDPGRRGVRWVELSPGTGFTVHLTARGPQAISLTYSIVEPA